MRSMLSVPGDSPRKFEKTSAANASALILDPEGSVVLDTSATFITVNSQRPLLAAVIPQKCSRPKIARPVRSL